MREKTKATDTGMMAWRQPHEPPDGRRCLNARPFWSSLTEQLTFENVVDANPQREGEGPFAYIERLAEAVEPKLAKLPRAMPPTRQTRRQRDDNLQHLREQIARDRVIGEGE